ncbi:PTS sugar transporter subunit IIA [Sphingomonas bacterium]|uniref:PTS sugar transporter subunit IIA n=1 Tax=Sphingomonas bacterium TaxID=1895847 RepID=UPI00157664E9|nr:PTS sugar transporter subunit IIA [Sphingomonas bacterium]
MGQAVLLNAEAVRIGLPAATRKMLFIHIGTIAATTLGLEGDRVADALAARERLGSTGFGGGIAIPHAKLAGISEVAALLIRLAQPIAFKAVDDRPVDIVLAMLSPPDAGADHLKALAQVSRRLRDQSFVAKLRGAGSPDALYALWTADEARDAG